MRKKALRETVGEHIREQWGMYFLVTLFFVLGIAAGALSVRLLSESQSKELNEYFFTFVDYLTERQPMNQSLILQRSLLLNSAFTALLWLCGTVFFGFLPILLLLLYRGFAIGFTVGFLAQQNALGGILFSLGSVMPQNLIYVPVSIMAGVFSVSFSLALLRRRFSRKAFPFGSYLFNYTMAMLIVLLLFAAGSLVETVITPVFMRAVVSLM